MGKKKAKTTKAPERNPRKEAYTVARINQHVERLREQAGRLATLARQMEEADVEIIVDGHAMLLRGLNQVDNFADNATRAVREAKLAQERL
jgi:division protein CdvB (Snf7/Vps24/ESCRT-III family)